MFVKSYLFAMFVILRIYSSDETWLRNCVRARVREEKSDYLHHRNTNPIRLLKGERERESHKSDNTSSTISNQQSLIFDLM